MIAFDSFLDRGAVLDVVRTEAFSAGKCSWRVLCGVEEGEDIHVHFAAPASSRSYAFTRKKPQQFVLLVVRSLHGVVAAQTVRCSLYLRTAVKAWSNLILFTVGRRAWSFLPMSGYEPCCCRKP